MIKCHQLIANYFHAFEGPKTATKYIITGKTESVKSAAAQFEKILGLDPGSSNITDTTNKINLTTDGGVGGVNNLDANDQSGMKSDGEFETIGSFSLKKVRRKKKRGKGSNAPRNSKDGPPQNLVAEKGDI